MLTRKHIAELDALELQPLYEKLQKSVTLASLVLTAWQIGLWFACHNCTVPNLSL